MFLRCKVRRKDGKQHRYWSVVENTRVALWRQPRQVEQLAARRPRESFSDTGDVASPARPQSTGGPVWVNCRDPAVIREGQLHPSKPTNPPARSVVFSVPGTDNRLHFCEPHDFGKQASGPYFSAEARLCLAVKWPKKTRYTLAARRRHRAMNIS